MKSKFLIALLLFLFASRLLAGEKILTLDLKSAYSICCQNNLLYKQKAFELEEAKARLSQANAAFLPQLSSSYTFIRTEPVPEFKLGEETGTPAPDAEIFPKDNYQLSLTFSQLISSFGRAENAARMAKLLVNFSQLEVKRVGNDLNYQVTQAYAQAFLALRGSEIARDKVKSVENHLKIAEQKFQQGTAPRFDLVREKTSLAQSQEEAIKAENAANLAFNNLKNLLGLNLDQEIALTPPPESQAVKYTQAESMQISQEMRPEILQFKTLVDLADKNLKKQIAEYYPSLSLNATYDWTRESLMSQPRTFTGMAVFSLPVYQGATNPKIREAKNALERTKTSYQDLERNVKLEIKQAILSLDSAQARIKAARENVALAKEALEIAQVRYREGMGTILELNDAELALRAAELTRESADSDYLIANAALLKAVGKLQEEK